MTINNDKVVSNSKNHHKNFEVYKVYNMKKTLFLVLSFFVLCFFSCATKTVESATPSEIIESSETITKSSETPESSESINSAQEINTKENQEDYIFISPKINPNEPEFSLETAKILDSYWSKYFTEKNNEYLDNIFEYIECENLLEQFINNNFDFISKDERIMNHLSSFCEISDSGVDFLVDYELISGILLTYSYDTEEIKYLYSQIPSDIYLRAVMRSTALWSFLSNAYQDNNVNLYFEKKLFSLSEEIFYAINCVYKTNSYPVCVSPEGVGTLDLENCKFIVGLVDNIQETVEQWDTLPTEQAPSIAITNKVTPETLIAPFVAYGVKEGAQMPLFYDCDIIDPFGNIITNEIRNLKLAEKIPENTNNLYRAVDYFNFGITEDEVAGEYAFRIFIHNGTEVIAVFELSFNFKK